MKKIIYSIIVLTALTPMFVFAQDDDNPDYTQPTQTYSQNDTLVPTAQTNTSQPSYTLLTPLPCVGASQGSTCTGTGSGSQITSINFQDYLVYVFKLAISLAVFLAIIMIIYGGFKYMSVESVIGKSGAKKTIQDAVVGLLLALGSYLILYTINPSLVNLTSVNAPKLNISTSNVNLNANQPADTSSNSQAQQGQIGAANQGNPDAGSAALSGQMP